MHETGLTAHLYEAWRRGTIGPGTGPAGSLDRYVRSEYGEPTVRWFLESVPSVRKAPAAASSRRPKRIALRTIAARVAALFL